MVFTNIVFEEHGNQSVNNFVLGLLAKRNVYFVTIEKPTPYFEKCVREMNGLRVFYPLSLPQPATDPKKNATATKNLRAFVKRVFRYRSVVANSDIWQGVSLPNAYATLKRVHAWIRRHHDIVLGCERLVFIDSFGGQLLKYLKWFDAPLYEAIRDRTVGYYLGTVLTQFYGRSLAAVTVLPLSFYGSYKPAHAKLIITNDGTRGDEVFRNWLGFDGPILFVYNGLDERLVRAKRSVKMGLGDSVRFVVCSRLTKWKHVERGIEIMASLRGMTSVPFQLSIIGDGLERQSLIELVAKRGLGDRVRFFGGMHYDLALEEIGKSDFYMFFNELSNLGNQVFESITLGTIPVTLDDHSTDSLLIHGKNSLKISSGDGFTRRAAELLAEYIEQPAAIDELRRNLNLSAEKLLTWRQRNELERQFLGDADKFDQVQSGVVSNPVAATGAKNDNFLP